MEITIGPFIGKTFVSGIPSERLLITLLPKFHGDDAQVTQIYTATCDIKVGDRLLPRGNALQEVLDVEPGGVPMLFIDGLGLLIAV
jgi:hypothetical protein